MRRETLETRMGLQKQKKRGGARHFAKPYVEPSLLMKTLSEYKKEVMDMGPYECVSKTGAINPKGLVQCRFLLEDLLKLSPTGEIHSGAFRTSFLNLVAKDPAVNNSRFNGSTWANLRQERFSTLLLHLRKVAREEQALHACASKLTGSEYAQLRALAKKVEVKKEDAKEREESSSVELDEKGYPLMLATPPGEKAALCDKEEGWDSLQEGHMTPLKEGKGKKRKATPLQEGSCKSKPSTMWRRDGALVAMSRAGEEDDLEEAMGFKPKQIKQMKKPAARKPAEPAAASSGCRRPWEKVRVTEANKPKPRAYITGCHAGEKKLRLICEVSIARTNQYKKIIYLIKEQLERKDLLKEEAIQLREKLCKQYPTRK